MKTFAVIQEDGRGGHRRTEVRAATINFERGSIVFLDDAGILVSAFKKWVRIDRAYA
jgi:hypothetical protein